MGKRIQVIVNGIDTKVFCPSPSKKLRDKLALKDDTFVILAIANVWNMTKGIQDVFALSQKLSRGMVIVMVGLHKRQMKRLPENIIGIRHTENLQELVELYSLADVLINPTYQDTFPSINIEALACGTPVITYNTGGCGEAVDEHTGIVVPRGDLDKLLDSVYQIQQRGKSAYTAACRKRAVDFFDKNKRYEEYFELYEKSRNK
jgi:glycosyltransferase involved in cell wall biosynthesis